MKSILRFNCLMPSLLQFASYVASKLGVQVVPCCKSQEFLMYSTLEYC